MIMFSLITTIPLNRADSYLYRNLYEKSSKSHPYRKQFYPKAVFTATNLLSATPPKTAASPQNPSITVGLHQ